MINCFEHIKAPKVLKEIDVYKFIEVIKSPNKATLLKIQEVRSFYKNNKDRYDYLKSKLPCFTLNFSFNDTKRNKNIKAQTGLIYLDIDNN